MQFSGTGGATPVRLDFNYNPTNQTTTITRSQNLGGSSPVSTSGYSYDLAGRMTNIVHQSTTMALATYAYAYDLANRLSSARINAAPATNYGYDDSGELLSAGAQAYGYDAAGNRNMIGYQTGPANQLQNDGTWTYTYDAENNISGKVNALGERVTYTYDQQNHLLTVDDTGGPNGTIHVSYLYDVFSNRIQQTEAVTPPAGTTTTTITNFAYDQGNVWADFSNGQLATRRLFGPNTDQLLARIDSSGNLGWYFADRQGSITMIVNGNVTQVADQLTYDAYGRIVVETTLANGDRYKWTGREWSQLTGLQYNRARYYDPATGKWTSEDRWGFAAGDSHLSRYVHNGPTNATDPSGRYLVMKNHDDAKAWTSFLVGYGIDSRQRAYTLP